MWLLGALAVVFVAARLWFERLHRIYPLFFGYLLFLTTRTVALVLFGKSRSAYAWLYFTTQPLIWVFFVLVSHELYTAVFRNYRGIGRYGRYGFYGLLVFALCFSAASLILSWSGPVETYPILRNAMQLERGVDVAVVILLLAILSFLVWWPIPLNRNVIVHTFIFFVYFLTHATVLLVRTLGGPAITRAASTASLALSLGCFCAWLVLMNSQGETRIYRERVAHDPANEDQLLANLEAINSSLLKAGRKADVSQPR